MLTPRVVLGVGGFALEAGEVIAYKTKVKEARVGRMKLLP